MNASVPDEIGADAQTASEPMPAAALPAWRALLRDPVFRGALGLFGLLVAAYSLPILSYARLVDLVTVWVDPLLIVLAIVAFHYGNRRLRAEERAFWMLMSAAIICSTGGTWLPLVVPAAEWSSVQQIAQDVLFLGQFVFMFLAISLNPHSRDAQRRISSIRFRLESAGTVSFATLILIYFVFIPVYFGEAGSELPKTMSLALGAMLTFSFFYVARYCESSRWTVVYRLLGYGLALWAVADGVELMVVTGRLYLPGGIPYGTGYDFIVYLPFGLAVAAARYGRAGIDDEPVGSTAGSAKREIRYLFGPLAVYTTSLPLIHFALSSLGMLDAAGRPIREATVFFGLVLLGSLTLINEKLIDRQRRHAETENKRLAAFPIKNPNPFLTFSGDGNLKFLNPAAKATLDELGLETIEDFLPPRHAKLVRDCMVTRSGYRDIEVAVSGKVFSFGYYPNPSGDDVFVYVMDITERKRAEGKLKYDALHDTLTGLPNRTLVMEILARSIHRSQREDDYRFALLFVDLNRFKLVNDSLGHLAGDRFLVEISKRLESCLRRNDVVGRFGGDEFVLIIDDVRDVRQATRTAERIQTRLGEPLEIDGQEIVTSACIGIAMSDSRRGRPEDYLRDADIAMYRAKQKGPAGFEVFDQEMHDEAVAQLQLENQLRKAIDRDEFMLYYQPYVDLTTGSVLGFEGLIRWQHPEIGIVPPGDFIPLAEDTGLIVPIGWWVIDTACHQLTEWESEIGDAEFTLSVNVSTRQLTQSDFAGRLGDLLGRFSIDRSRLTLEITESVMTDLGDDVIELLREIKALGVKLAVDDFGTGYSSLSYLRRFPVDSLKIDRSFISSLDETSQDVAIVRAITTLAENLELGVVAEGVETLQQANQLRLLGCRIAQGFLFSMPVEAQRASEVLRQDMMIELNRRAG